MNYYFLFQIRQKVSEAKDTDKILDETRGNKTTAQNLQRRAERASQRAAAIHSALNELWGNSEFT